MKEKSLYQVAPEIKRSKLPQLPLNPEQKGGRFPSWLHRRLPEGGNIFKTGSVLDSHRLHTVCEEAKCPNRLECWSQQTATFLALGKECTRNCGFCSIDFSKTPAPLDDEEPQRIAESVKALVLKHVVITMVARDDLEDGGAGHLVKIVRAVRESSPSSTIELLTSDFHGNRNAWEVVIAARPEVFNHNIETVRRLTPRVRHKATYDRTLEFLKFLHGANISKRIKSGLMLGLGEEEAEVQETLHDLHSAGCSIVTIGQYLQPTAQKLLVKAFITPEQFKSYEEYGKKIGIKDLYCGPFVRSSYNAALFAPNA